MAVGKWSFKLFLVPKQWKVTNTRKNNKWELQFLAKNVSKPKPTRSGKTTLRKATPDMPFPAPYSLPYAFGVIHVCSHRGLWQLPCADTGPLVKWWSHVVGFGSCEVVGVEEAKLLGGPRIQPCSLIPPRNNDLLKWPETLGFELLFKELF